MTTPLPVLPQLIVEAGLLPDSPVQGGTTIFLNTGPGLNTGTLGSGIAWTDISQWVLGFTVSRPSTRQQGPLWNYQAATASITLDNSDGRFDVDNSGSPYTGNLAAMVPVRVRAVFAGVLYPLFNGFADGWLPATVTYEGGYAELTLPATDVFKILAGVTLAAVAVEGVGADTGARVKDILTRVGWYTSADRNVISTGSSTLQGTTLGDTALSLMQLACDSEIGQLYGGPSGEVVFRARHDLLTDTRSNTVQATFGDLPVTGSGGNFLASPDSDFEGASTGHWVVNGNCAVAASGAAAHGGTGSMSMTSSASGSMSAASCAGGSITSLGLPVGPTQAVTVSAWFLTAASARSVATGAQFYTAGGGFISTVTGAFVTDSTSAWTKATAALTAPSNAAYCRAYVQVSSTGGASEVHYVDDVSLASGTELAYAAVGRASDDTTIANDIQATRSGGTLQEAKDTASITKYLFPRVYARSDLILQNDTDTLAWAQWVLYISKSGEDRFESLAVDPAADPVNLWPQCLGMDIGDRIQVWTRPAGVTAPVSKDCFIAGISHAWDSVSSAWLTTWTLQDASKYGSFLTLDNATLGQLNANALAF